ncbi:prolipoprotein diacylglyceryl transferase [Hymenobacter gummosus]|uniref:Phosphatidylglycerol--prolipoprotein diacylglyceryl transferase n=1 Tax=Hymenobacter gummosus TaxID=1776032 RepID=A0A3S0HA57_9BACT|nr:prolipoprotein diacylglyceryl transferase [Hymenobacter gummosus]RTQ50666.1 prolipoprotein diacylglyceryl transferase [Hymenobacter gummosus]
MLAYIPWDVSPIIAQLGPFALRWYGLLFAAGFIIGSFILTHIYKAEKVSPRWVDVITIYMLIGTVLGARLGHVLFYDPDHYLSNPLEILKIWEGGLASHGATLGILLAVWLFARNNKFDYLWVLDRIVIVVATGGMCIRLGNLMNSEIIGKQTDVPWAFKFVRYNEIHNTRGPIPQELHHPTQIYEALFCLLLFVLLYALWNRWKASAPRGFLFGLFVTLLFSFRFLVEFLKENQEGFESTWALAPLNMGQVLSIPLVLVGLAVLFTAGRRPGRPEDAPRDLGLEAQPQKPLPVQMKR